MEFDSFIIEGTGQQKVNDVLLLRWLTALCESGIKAFHGRKDEGGA